MKEDDFINEQQWDTITHFPVTRFSFKKALRLYPGRVEQAVGKELKQLHSCEAFVPQDATKLMPQQYEMDLESIMMVKEKQDESLKGRFVVDGRK